MIQIDPVRCTIIVMTADTFQWVGSHTQYVDQLPAIPCRQIYGFNMHAEIRASSTQAFQYVHLCMSAKIWPEPVSTLMHTNVWKDVAQQHDVMNGNQDKMPSQLCGCYLSEDLYFPALLDEATTPDSSCNRWHSSSLTSITNSSTITHLPSPSHLFSLPKPCLLLHPCTPPVTPRWPGS